MFDYSLEIFKKPITSKKEDIDESIYLKLTSFDLTLRRAPLLFDKIRSMIKYINFSFNNETFIKTWKQLFSLLINQLQERINLLSDFYKDKYIYKKTVTSMNVDLFYDKFFDLFYFKEDPELRAREEDGERFDTFSDLPENVKAFYLKLRIDVIKFISDIVFSFDLPDYNFKAFAYYHEEYDIMIINRLFTDLLSSVFVLKDQPATNY